MHAHRVAFPPDCYLLSLQVTSVSVAATFTVLQGQVTTLGWMFREDLYAPVRRRPATCPHVMLMFGLHDGPFCLSQ